MHFLCVTLKGTDLQQLSLRKVREQLEAGPDLSNVGGLAMHSQLLRHEKMIDIYI